MSDTGMDAISSPAAEPLQFTGIVKKLFRMFFPPGVRLIGAGIQFVSTVLIARHLGDSESAVFFFWSAVLTSFAIVATFGLENIVLRTVPRLKKSGSHRQLTEFLSTVRGIALVLSILIGVGLIIYAYLRDTGDDGHFHSWYLLLPFTLCAMAFLIINGETLKGLSHPAAGVFFGHFIPVSLFCGMILLNLNKLSSPLLITIYSAAYLTGVALTRFSPSRVFFEKRIKVPEFNRAKSTLAESLPIFSANALGSLGYVIPLAILEISRPAAEVSYLTTSFRIAILLSILATAIHGVFAPQLSCAAEIKGNIKGVFKVYAKSSLGTFSVLVIPALVGILFPEWVMSIFGEDFRAGAETLRWLLVSCTVSMFLGPVYQLLIMTESTKFLAFSGVAKLVVVLVLSFLLIPTMGGVGVVLAKAVAFFGEEVAGILWVVRKLKGQKFEGI